MNEITIFSNDEFGQIRTLVIDEQPWFVGKDVAEVLGYADTSKAIRMHVDDEDKTTQTICPGGSNYKTQAILINESGLYSLIFASKLPAAKRFKRWVTAEVLPQIRRYGMFATDDTLNSLIDDPDNAIQIFRTMKEERLARIAAETQQRLLQYKMDEMEPLANYCREILTSPETVTVTQIAQDYGMSAIKLNEMLRDMNIQYRQNEQWILYSKYKLEGYVQSNTSTYTRFDGTTGLKMFTRWTQKGRMFLYERLKAEGILPLCEK